MAEEGDGIGARGHEILQHLMLRHSWRPLDIFGRSACFTYEAFLWQNFWYWTMLKCQITRTASLSDDRLKEFAVL
jgi:hypothetical protein